MDVPKNFSFDWILNETENRKVECIDYYSEGGYDLIFVRSQIRCNGDEWETRYESGNPLLGGIKSYNSYNNAEKYFYELIGRIHRAVLARKEGEQ